MSDLDVGMSTAKAASLSEVLDFINAAESTAESGGFPIKVNFLRNLTIEGVEPFFKYHCLKSGLKPLVTFGNYDMVRQEVLDRTSHIYTDTPDVIVVALYLETYLSDQWLAGWNAAEVMNDLAGLFAYLARNTAAIVAINTFVPPFYTDLGITSSTELPSHDYEVQQLNRLVRDFVRSHPSRFVLMDWERFIRQLGENESMDYRFWYMSKAPFKKGFLDLYARELVKVARALKGKSKKCLIMDCDNTLWGGIVGEDGLHGIKLDRHSYPGNTFYQFQNSVLKLRERGVLIALCSKNNEQDVWEVLESHPHCLLKREHLAAWRVNWQDKASNLRALAGELNLGLDSFVFVDDNPAECGLIRDLLPEVTILQVPEKLYTYPLLLKRDGLFDTLTLSAEDRQRSRMYCEEANRKHEQAKYDTLEQYLESLALSITVHHAKPGEVPRIAQLTQKTNQFNLTTRRYSEAQIASYANDPEYAIISLSVRDKFGDSGLTGVLIARKVADCGVIDTLLLSCRVLGRNIEVAFALKSLEIIERGWQVNAWQAEYVATQKNRQVAGFWKLLGFMESSHQEVHTFYELRNNAVRHEEITYVAIEEE